MEPSGIGNQEHTIPDILQVQHYGSVSNTLYKILAPIQMTVEYCSGLDPADYYNVILVSTTDHWFHSGQTDTWFGALNNRTQHRHDYYELLLVLEGEVIQQIEGKEYLYRAGTCCLINRNVLHAERFTGRAKICFLGLSLECIQDLLHDAGGLYYTNEHRLQQNPILQFMQDNLRNEIGKEYLDLFPTRENDTAPQQLHDIADQLVKILLNPHIGASYYLKGLLCELFDDLQTGYYVTPVRLKESSDGLLFLRIQHLMEDTNGRLSRAELSRLLHYNGSYLNDIVQHHTGMCLFDYGMTFCYRRAEQLLTETDLPVSEIATQLHFSNRTHFYSLFRRQYGMTPQAYRKLKRPLP